MAIVKLAEIATVITKGTTPTSIGFDFVADGINFVKIESITEAGCFIPEKFAHITEECHQKLSRSILQKNDVLFSIAGAIGRTAIVNENILPANTNQALAIIRIPDGVVNYSYLKYVLESPIITQQFEKKKQGVAQLNISLKDIGDFTIPLPSLVVQQKIVATLTHTDTLISLRKQQIAKLDELVKARFVEMFGMPGSDPFGWGLNHLGDCCQINPKRSQDTRLRSGLTVSFVPMSAVSETGDMDPTTEKDYEEVKTGFTYFAEGDVLFAKITPCMENGKGAVARNLKNGIGFGSTEFHVLRPLAGKSDSDWLYAVTAFSEFRKDAESNMTGSAGQRRVPASFLEQYKVALPPVDMQHQFAAFVAQTDQQKLTIQHSLAQLELLKKALMQKYFG